MCNPLMMMAGIQATSALAGGIAQQQAGRAQAQLIEAQGAADRDQMKAQAEQVRRQTGRTRGAARAALAGAGADVSQGSALVIDEDIMRRGEGDALQMLLTGDRRASEARFAARSARRAGDAALVQSALSAAGTMSQSRWRGQQVTKNWWEPSAPIIDKSTRGN